MKLVCCPRFDSCAPAHCDLSVCPSMSLASPRLHSRSYPRHFTSMSLIPFAPFGRCNGERTNVRCARSRSQCLKSQAACVAGKTSHSDVPTAIGRTPKGVRGSSSDGNDPPPQCYGAASGRRRFRGSVSALSVISLRRNGISTTSYRDAIRDSRIATVVNKLVWAR